MRKRRVLRTVRNGWDRDKMLTISNGWKFENEVYSFSLIGKQYVPKKDAEKGIKIEISNVEYTLVKE